VTGLPRHPETVDVRVPGPLEIGRALGHLRAGGLLAYPTETVYGFGGSTEPDAVAGVLSLKGRDRDRPVLLLVPSPDDTPGLEWTHEARELASVFWPGALTLVLRDPEASYPPGVRSEAGGVAVRQSAHPVAAALVAGLGGPLTSTSANAPGEPPARSGDEAVRVVAALEAGDRVLVLDAGVLPDSAPSTVVDCTGPVPRVVREGAVPLSRLRCVLPGFDERES
jgi:L-threonylcarbamoyladenylate synthase